MLRTRHWVVDVAEVTPSWAKDDEVSVPAWASDKPDAADPKADAPGFSDRLSEDLLKRANNATTGATAQKMSPLALLEGSAGGAKDLGAEVAQSAWNYTPDTIKDPLKYVGKHVAANLKDTDLAKLSAAAAKKGGDIAQNHPVAAEGLSAVANMGGIGATSDLIKGAKSAVEAAGPVMKGKVGPALEKKGENLIKSAEVQKTQRRTDFVNDLISPKQTNKVKTEQVGRTTEKGLLRTKIVEPTKEEKSIAEEVAKLPVSKGRSIQGNYNVVRKENEDEAKRLIAKLEKNDIAVKPQELETKLGAVAQELEKTPFMQGNGKASADYVMNGWNVAMSKHPPTVSGLLQARKDFDSWVKRLKGDGIFTAQRDNPNSVAVSKIRSSVNDFIESQVPDEGYKKSLRKQNLLYKAMENMDDKAAVEGKNIVSRTVQKIAPHKESMGKIGAGLAGAGIGAGTIGAVPTAAVAGAGALGYGGYKAATGPTAKKVTGKIMQRFGKDLKGKEAPKLLTEDRPMVHVPGEGIRKMTDAEWMNSKDINDKYSKLGLTNDVLRVQDRNTISTLEKKYGQSELGKFIAQNHNQPIMGRVWETPYTEYSQATVDKMLRNSAWDKLEKSQKQQISSQIEKAWNEHKTPIADMILQARKGAADLAAAKKESFSPTAMQDKLLKAAQTGTSLERVARDMQ